MTSEGSMVEAQAARGEDQGGSIKELIEFLVIAVILVSMVGLLLGTKLNQL